jgi:hypothetical protein
MPSFKSVLLFTTGIFILFLLSKCDSPGSTETQEITLSPSDKLSLTSLPFETNKYLFNPSDPASAISKLPNISESQPPYGCVISTLNNITSKKAYTYRAWQITFPEKVIEAANGKSKRFILTLADEGAGSLGPKEYGIRAARAGMSLTLAMTPTHRPGVPAKIPVTPIWTTRP